MLSDMIIEWGGHEVSAMEVYTDIFRLGEGYIQKSGEPSGEFKANPIAYYRMKDRDRGNYRIMFEDTFEEVLNELQDADEFAIMNGITYFGRKNVQSHASKMYAMIFDLDGVTEKSLNAFFSGAFAAKAYPVPNYVILSGHGVHLYYVFEQPISLYPYMKIQLKDLKYALTARMWNHYTSMEQHIQFQGINQGFRVIGSRTKDGSESPTVRAFRVNEHPFSISELCEFVPEAMRVDETQLWKERKMTLAQAKKKYPEWYEKVIVNQDTTRKYWDISAKVNGDNPYALYDWWKRQIYIGATYHHRYFAIMCLAIYGVKCRKPFEEVEQDAYEISKYLNSIEPNDPFTKEDCDAALECYDLRYCTFPIKDIEKISGIVIPRNKRNGRKKSTHIKIVNATRKFKRDELGEDEYKGNGRPSGSGTAEQKVREWQEAHPNGKKADCIRDTRLSKPTVYKWWQK